MFKLKGKKKSLKAKASLIEAYNNLLYEKTLREQILKKFEIEKQEQEQAKLRLEVYRKNPLIWLEERFKENASDFKWSLLKGYQEHCWDGDKDPLSEAWQALANGQWAAVLSCTGSGKTYLLPRIICWFLDCWEDSLVVTTAPKEDQLKLLLWAEMSKCFNKFQKIRPNAELGSLSLRLGSKTERKSWMAIGFTAGVAASEQSTVKAQGFHRKDMLIIFEETPGMPEPTMKAFENTSIGEHNLIFAVGNPDHQNDPLYKFAQKKSVKSFRISAYDHPNAVLKENLIPGAVTLKSIEQRKQDYGEDSPFFQSRVRGIAPAQSVDSLIRLEWVQRAFKSETQKDGTSNACGIDVANSPLGDYACIAWGEENRLIKIDRFKSNDASLIADKVQTEMKIYKVPESSIGLDVVGVGVSTLNRFHALNMQSITPLQGGQWDEAVPCIDGRPIYRFSSLRCQMYWELREDLRMNLICFDLTADEMELVKNELIVPKWSTRSGTIYLEPKEEIKKRLGHSCDVSDAVAMWNFVRKRHRSIDFHSLEHLDYNFGFSL